jgi:carboxypeptidase PM20D1
MTPDIGAAVNRFARSVRFATVSARIHEEETRDAYVGLLDFIVDSYPHLFAAAHVEREDPWRLVVELPGTDSSLEPLLVLAHFDVVPVEPGTESAWSHPPFSGAVDDGFIWGRGTLDDKNVLIAALEAAERVVSCGKRLERGLVLAFGGDEELSGIRGAAESARTMRRAGRRFHFVLDEGAVIALGMLTTPSAPIALIGIAEKGHLNVALTATTIGGHAAMPPSRTAVGKLAKAIARIEARRFPSRLTYTMREFFRALAPHARFPHSFVYRHPRLFWPILRRVLASRPETDALTRTTQAATTAEGSRAPNVLPQHARAVINVRTLPGEQSDEVIARYRRLLAREDVEVSLLDPDDRGEPVAGSSLDHPGYRTVTEVAASLCDCVPAPFLVTGTTDSTWYADLTDAVYRFIPMALASEDIARIHGTDERLSIENFARLIDFYELVITRECVHE